MGAIPNSQTIFQTLNPFANFEADFCQSFFYFALALGAGFISC
jgi:hypothetical protein